MRRKQTEAIILSTYPQRERDKLVVFLSPESGKLRGWVYGARSRKNRYGASLEPLSKVVIHYAERENDEIMRIEAVDLIRSAFPAQQNLRGSVALSYIAELADVFAQAEEPSEVLYRLLDRSTEALLAGVRPVVVVGYAELWMLKIAGLLPSLRHCIACSSVLELPLAYSRSLGGFLCPKCDTAGSERFANRVSELLWTMLRLPVEEVGSMDPDEGDLFELRRFAVGLRREFLQHELKSWTLLQSVLGAPGSG
jgi:DNA repair protein RecO (recombination protein O)